MPSARVLYPLRPPCKPSTVDLGGRQIGFFHARLAMNAHFFGPGHGLKLEQLEMGILPYIHGWQTDSRARIFQNQLFIRFSHRLRLEQDPEFIRIAARSAYNHLLPYICSHIVTHIPRRNPRDFTAAILPKFPN